MKWFRLYSEILDDPKIQKLSDAQFRDFIYMMCLACEVEKEGLIPYSKEEISWRLRRDLVTLCDGLVTLAKCHIVTDNGDGIKFLHWKKRQYKSDSSAERTRRYREKQNTVTSQKRHSDGIEQNRDRYREDNIPPIPPKNEKSTKQIFSLPDFISESVWQRFLNHRKAVKAPIQKDSWESFVKKFEKLKDEGWEPEKVVDTMIEKGWRWFKPEWVNKNGNKERDPGLVKRFFGDDYHEGD